MQGMRAEAFKLLCSSVADHSYCQLMPAFSSPREGQMSDNNTPETILIRENTLLPAGLAVESEVFLPDWRVVKNLDRSTLARNIEGANWNFFHLAGEIRATVLGRDRSGTLRRAVRRVLAKQKGQKFNSLEITNVVSKRFLGIPFIN